MQQNVVFDVGWDSVSKRCVPIDSTGWQFTQTRGIVAVQTSSGSMCLIPMGMAHVSLVTFELEVVAGASVKNRHARNLSAWRFGLRHLIYGQR